MKFLEEFENDLLNTNSVKRLFKAMRANGIESIGVTDFGTIVAVNVFGLIQNVPVEQWNVLTKTQWAYQIGAKVGAIEIICTVQANSGEMEEIVKAGFVFPSED